MAGPKSSAGAGRRAKGSQAVDVGPTPLTSQQAVVWREALVWARETRALLADPALSVTTLRRERRRWAGSLALAKKQQMPDAERVRRELAQTVAAIDECLVKRLRRR